MTFPIFPTEKLEADGYPKTTIFHTWEERINYYNALLKITIKLDKLYATK